MKRASYRFGVEWIALNDDPSAPIEDVETQISTLLLADLFGVESRKVAEDVMRFRKKRDGKL